MNAFNDHILKYYFKYYNEIKLERNRNHNCLLTIFLRKMKFKYIYTHIFISANSLLF